MSSNIPGNNGIPRKQVFARPLGSATGHVQSGGWRPAARGANPHDTVSLKAGMYARARAQANVYAGRNSLSFGQLVQSSSNQEMSAMEIMMMAQMGIELGKGLGELTKGIVDLFKSDNPEKAEVKQNQNLSGGDLTGGAVGAGAGVSNISTENASLVSDMANAKDAASLESAVQNVQAKLNEITTSMPGLEEAKNTAETRKQELDTQKNKLLQEYRQAETDLKTANATLKEKKTTLDSTESKLKSALKGKEDRYADYLKAQGQTSLAGQNLELAKTSRDALKAQLNKESSNSPDRAILQAALDSAEQRVRDAESELVKAQQNEADAKKELDEAKINVEILKTNHSDLIEKYDEAQKGYNEAQKAVKELEAKKAEINEKLDAINSQINDADGAIAKYAKAKADQEALTAEKAKHEPRIEQLRAQEIAQYNTLAGQIDMTNGVDTKADKEAMAQMQAMEQAAIDGILKGPAVPSVAGVELRKGKGPDGSDIFLIGDKKVTEDEYNKKAEELATLEAGIQSLASYQEGSALPTGFKKVGKPVELNGRKFIKAETNDGNMVYMIDGQQVDRNTFYSNRTSEECNLPLNTSQVIAGTKFEVLETGMVKVNGQIVPYKDVADHLSEARTKEYANNIEQTLNSIQAGEGTATFVSPDNQEFTVIAKFENGTFTYKLGEQEYSSMAELKLALTTGRFTLKQA